MMIKPKRIWLTDDAVCMETTDGITVSEPFVAYPRLKKASKSELEDYYVSNVGIHWESLDEDLSFEGFFKEKRAVSPLTRIFQLFPEINISAFARRMGIPQSLMAAYVSGIKTPSKSRLEAIKKELHNIGKALLEV